MHIKDHGVWERYVPSKLPRGAPASALFTKRRGDGVDWYNYVNNEKSFFKDTIKLTVNGDTVSTATTDATMLFPDGARVLEISGVHVANPLKVFGRKIYDAASKSFRDPPAQPDFTSPMADILKRLKALEDKEPPDAPSDDLH